MALRRGRAASPIRPGIIVKSTLSGITPLRSGERVTQAAIVDLFNAYKGVVEGVNSLRPKEKHIRGMRYQSFYTMFRFSRLLGLVVQVATEPMLFPPPTGQLYQIAKPDGVHVVTSVRRIFKLTTVGEQDELSWTDLRRAWSEHWIAPQKVEDYVPPPAPPEKLPEEAAAISPEAFTPYAWYETPTIVRFKSLLVHMRRLEYLGTEFPGITNEVYRLSQLIGDWVISIEDGLEVAKETNKAKAVIRLTKWYDGINRVSEALGDEDLSRAIATLKELVG